MQKKIIVALVASFTLGLMPFNSEPHIWGKLKWIAGGAQGMQATDWLDTLLHGTPWVLLFFFVFQWILSKNERN